MVAPSKEDEDSPEDTSFPCRELCGALQYLQCMWRADISCALQKAAREVHKPTKATVAKLKRILRYLIGTKYDGIEYSPKHERAFSECYSKILAESESGNDKSSKLPSIVTFSDSDFGGDNIGKTATFKSTSGSAAYYRGTIIFWS